MKIYITSAYSEHPTLDVVTALAKLDTVQAHQLCESPHEADVILFVENAHFDDYLFRRLRADPLVKKYPKKVYMFNEVDKPWAVLPGLYPSMPKNYFQENRQVSFGYFKTPNDFVKDIYKSSSSLERKWLFSFVGAMSHRCRKSVMALSEEMPSIQDTSDFNVWHCSADTKAVHGRHYADIMASSNFVLCPRGLGTSSFRLFEAMEAGRAPVVISNQWVEPDFVNWDFAIRIPEHKIKSIPAHLASIKDEALERGLAARAAWEQYFAPDRIFHSAADAIEQLSYVRHHAKSKVFFQSARKVLIESEIRLLSTARQVRTRFAEPSADQAS